MRPRRAAGVLRTEGRDKLLVLSDPSGSLGKASWVVQATALIRSG
jgi:hypothetical protein